MDEIKLPWPGWKTIRKIGKGGYGTVYEITRTDKFGVEEHAALKVLGFPQDETETDTLIAEGYDKDSITAYNRERLDKVINEYAMMMQMKGHRNIVRCDDCETVAHEDGMGWDVFIRMELLTSLHVKLKQGHLSEAEVIKLGKDLCQALKLCEEKKIVHRDIKPENIFVNEYGDYKLGDFGISRTMEHTTSATRTGSPRFMAPEVYKDQKYGSTVDIYSLGLVMYWLLNNYRMPFLPTDRPPTLQESEEALQKRMAGEEMLPAPANGSEELKKTVLKACSYEVSHRYAIAEDFYNALTSTCTTNEAKDDATSDECILETYETETVIWKKENEAESDIERKDANIEAETDVTMSVFNSGNKTNNEKSKLSGTYIELIPIVNSQKYDEVWLNESRKYYEEDEDYANSYKSALEGSVYGEEAIKRISSGELEPRFFTSFMNGITQLSIDGEDGTISGYDDIGGTVFKHTYKVLEKTDNKGSGIYITDDENAEGFKYFGLFYLRYSDNRNVIMFRYGANLDAIHMIDEGEYAYWIPYGIKSDYTAQDIKSFINYIIQPKDDS